MTWPRPSLRGVFTTQERLDEDDVARGLRMITANGVCGMSAGALQGGVFLSAFALAIGASNYEIGMLAAIGLLSQVMQLPGLYLVQRFGARRGITVVCAGTSRVLWIFIVLIPFLFAGQGISFLILWLLATSFVMSTCNPAWNSLLRAVVPADRFGRFFSRRLAVGTTAALLLTLLGGYFIDWWSTRDPASSLYAYSVLFFVGLLFGLAELVAIARIPEPTMERDATVDLFGLLSTPLRDGNFRQLLVFIALWSFAVNMAAPFFIIYMLDRIGVSLFMVTVLATISQLTNILFLQIWGRLTDRFSNKTVLSISGPLFLLAVLAWSFTTLPERHVLTVPLLVAIHVLSGVAMAGITLGATNISLKLSPHGAAHAYMTVFGLAGALTGAVAPVVGGVIADFFAFREMSLTFNWSEPARQVSMYAAHFRALDFLFALAAIVGFVALNRLTRIVETGEATEGGVVDALMSEVVMPLRSLSSVAGIRRLAAMPVDTLRRGLGGRPNVPRAAGPHEGALSTHTTEDTEGNVT